MPNFPGYLLPVPPLDAGIFRPAALAPVRFVGVAHAPRPEPHIDAVGELVAQVTDKGREMHARRLAEGLAFGVVEFAVGTGGYYPQNPTKVVPLDPGATGLEAEVYRRGFSGIEAPLPEATSFYCRLDFTEANYALGELMLVAEILDSPANPGEVGTKLAYAIAHFPIDAHHTRKINAWRVVVTF